MGPGPTRLLIWSVPTVAIFFSLLWYRRKRAKTSEVDNNPSTVLDCPKPVLEKTPEKIEDIKRTPATPIRSPFSRSLSGIGTAPIDIKTNRSPPLIVSDKDLDIEIEKIKSMKSFTSTMTKDKRSSPNQSSANESTDNSPIEELITSKKGQKQNKTPSKKAQKQNSTTKTTPIIIKAGNRSPTIVEPTNQTPEALEITSPTTVIIETTSPIIREIASSSPGLRETANQSPGIRDSANHSPADAMLASPSCSITSDGHHSDSDSGKGGSDIATPPPPSQDLQEPSCSTLTPKIMFHEFVIPQTLVGRLIGRHGTFVHQIKDKTNANILIKRHPENVKAMKVCSIEGMQGEIEAALDMIRDKFPEKRYSELSLEHVTFANTAVSLVPDCMHLKLVEGVNNDTIVSCMVTPRHLFLQQPTHPTFPSLNVLSAYMNACYSQENLEQPPPLPQPTKENTICSAHSVGAWYRAMILSVEDDTTCSVKFLDYGGYATLDQTMLRQIRGDFLLLPFQSSECLLAGVLPPAIADDGAELWPQEAYDFVADLTKGAVVYTQIVDYLEDCTPLVYIYVRTAEHFIFLNKELVNRGLAIWQDTPDDAANIA